MAGGIASRAELRRTGWDLVDFKVGVGAELHAAGAYASGAQVLAARASSAWPLCRAPVICASAPLHREVTDCADVATGGDLTVCRLQRHALTRLQRAGADAVGVERHGCARLGGACDLEVARRAGPGPAHRWPDCPQARGRRHFARWCCPLTSRLPVCRLPVAAVRRHAPLATFWVVMALAAVMVRSPLLATEPVVTDAL